MKELPFINNRAYIRVKICVIKRIVLILHTFLGLLSMDFCEKP